MHLLTLSVLVCLLSVTSAAPAIDGLSTVKKRSDEVIFFEDGSKGADLLAKRSEWNGDQNTKNQLSSKYSSLGDDTAEDKSKLKAKSSKVDPKILEEIRQEAFYDALDFFVEKVFDSASDEGVTTPDYFKEQEMLKSKNNVKEKIYNENKTEELMNNLKNVEKMFEENSNDDGPVIEQTATVSTTASPGQSDNEENELKSLIANKKSAHITPTTPKEREAEDVEETTPLSKYDDMFKYMASPEEMEQDAEELEELLEYMEYFDTLKLLEGKLKTRLAQSKTNEKQENSEKPKTRMRRSLVEGGKPELELAGKFGEERFNGEKGVYFTAQEAQELRDLLTSLAKERMESEELIKFLVDSLKAVYGDDVIETDYLTGEKRKVYDEDDYDEKMSQLDDYNNYNTEYEQYEKSPYNTNSKSAILERLAESLGSNQDRWKK